MFFKGGMKEVFLTNDVELFGFILSALKKENIFYKTKTVHLGTQNRRSGILLGQLGENINVEIMYYVYVSKKDAEAAEHLIEKCKKQVEH